MIGGGGCSYLLMLCLLTSQKSFVVAIPERRDELLRREYPLEEFLWTGSGEGPDRDEGQISWVTTTVFKTTTKLVATPVSASFTMVTAAVCPGEQQPCLTPSWQLESSALLEPSFSASPSGALQPTIWATPSISVVATATHTLLPSDRPLPAWPSDFDTPDKKFWIVTVVEEAEVESPHQPPLEAGLSRLYATAFKRQQEKHLGISNATTQRLVLQRKRRSPEVIVRLLNVTKSDAKRLQLVYLVQVKGQPVLARAAVNDMRFVSDAEVERELGMPVFTKAEPYLKEKEEAISQDKDVVTASPWVLAAATISVVSLLVLVVILLFLAATKRKRTNRLVDGATNMSFEPEVQSHGSGAKISEDWSVEALEDRQGRRAPDRAQSAIDAVAAVARGKPPSPTASYLSMPSVRKFPRGGEVVPQPLSEVLQQDGEHKRDHLSVKNLDVYPDESAFDPPGASTPPNSSSFNIRHGSLDGGDPGVIGPCVYQMSRGGAASRRRFQELVDDTFSLFGEKHHYDGGGSRSPTPPPRPPSPKVDSRVHSAAYLRVSTPAEPQPRPKTTEPRRSVMQQPRRRPPVQTSRASSAGPRGAWQTPEVPDSSGALRPLSAGPFHRPPPSGRPPPYPPRVCADYILADAQLPREDPAVPLISAIKSELQKFHSCSTCSIPGSISPSLQPRDTPKVDEEEGDDKE